MAERLPREFSSREKNARAEYKPPSTLPDPTPEPGYVYRWISTHVLGQSNPTNVAQKMREGWMPVKAADHPEIFMASMTPASGNIEIGGLMLCKMPSELASQRDAYYERKTLMERDAVDNHFMRDNDPRMPLFTDKKTSVSFGRGS